MVSMGKVIAHTYIYLNFFFITKVGKIVSFTLLLPFTLYNNKKKIDF